jgi:hypothetical protein
MREPCQDALILNKFEYEKLLTRELKKKNNNKFKDMVLSLTGT